MPTTPKRSHPYPSSSAVPDVPYDVQRLAETVDEDTYAALKSPCLILRRATNQAIPNNAQTQVSLTGPTLDGAPHVTWSAVNPGRILVNTEGLYAVTIFHLWTTNSTGPRAVGFRGLNAGTFDLYDTRQASTISTGITLSGEAWLLPGTYEVTAYQGSGGTLDLTRCEFVIRWVRYPPATVAGPAVVLR